MSLGTIGSGLDIPSLVSQLVANERAPKENQINNAGVAASAKLSSLGTIKSGMTSLQTALSALVKGVANPGIKASTPTESNFTAVIDTASTAGKPAAGTHEVEVRSLAQNQKLSSKAYEKDAVIGDGTLNIGYGEKNVSVTIPAGAKLSEVAAAINSAAGGKGVTAAVVTADDGQHLVLTAVDSGTKGALTVSTSGGNGGLGDLVHDAAGASKMTEMVAAKDAVVVVDGFTRTSSSNTVTDLVPGITLTLTKAEEGKKQTLTLTPDNSTLKTNLNAFISAYNSIQSTLKSSSAYNAETGTAATLTGDAMVRGLQQQLRSSLSANVNDMKTMGLTIAADGTLSLDAAKLDTAMAQNPEAAKSLFGAEGSIGKSMTALLKSNLDTTTGTITQRTNSLNKEIKALEKQLDDLDARMEKVSGRYTKQFTAMEGLVTQMQTASNTLSQQLANNSSKS
ncbi:flagellar filament capping protein FliD [Stenotrophomonas pennii]|uniref:flagellar filament capping protein FliD n=1 Tax=Stenotrophomonas lacuserhaii TaxID=2760084 RepID=UPI00320B86F5